MAAALTEMHGQGHIEVRSAGSEPADQVNPAAVEAMAELGVDIRTRRPKLLADAAVQASDVVITMGCGDACPIYPGTRYLDWDLDDPAGKDLDAVRQIRNEINRRVLDLVQELLNDGPDWERPTTLHPD
jgi:arsenate reductase